VRPCGTIDGQGPNGNRRPRFRELFRRGVLSYYLGANHRRNHTFKAGARHLGNAARASRSPPRTAHLPLGQLGFAGGDGSPATCPRGGAHFSRRGILPATFPAIRSYSRRWGTSQCWPKGDHGPHAGLVRRGQQPLSHRLDRGFERHLLRLVKTGGESADHAGAGRAKGAWRRNRCGCFAARGTWRPTARTAAARIPRSTNEQPSPTDYSEGAIEKLRSRPRSTHSWELLAVHARPA